MILIALSLGACWLPKGEHVGDSGGGIVGADGGGSADGGGDVPAGCELGDIDPSVFPAISGACRPPELVTVTWVADGDTFKVDSSQGEETIRFIGVNTPETGYGTTSVECYGLEASAFTKDHFPEGTCLWLSFDHDCIDPYDRTLAYLWTGPGEQDMYQRRLLQEGYARVLTIAPDDHFSELFGQDQAAAEAAGVGLWSACE